MNTDKEEEMKEEMNFIDELFEKELGAYEMGTASQGWAAVSAGLSKKGFLGFIKSSLWLKLAAGISTAGLITTIGIITLNPELLTDKQENNGLRENLQPTIVSDSEITNQSSAEDELHATTNNSGSEIPQPLSEKSDNSSLKNYLQKNDDIKPSKESSSYLSSSFENKNSNNILIAETSVIPDEVDNRNLQMPDPKRTESLSGNQATETFNPDNNKRSDNIEESTNNQILNQLIEDSYIADAITEKSNVLNTKSETEYIKDQNDKRILEAELISLAQNNNSSRYTFSAGENEALPIFNALPYRGFVPLRQQGNQTIALNQEYLSPPVPNSGYNPLSWAVSAHNAFHSPNLFLSTNNPESNSQISQVESGLQNPVVSNIGIRVEARGKNLLVESGLDYMELSQKANYQTLDLTFHENITWDYGDSSYHKIDTIDVYWQAIGTDTFYYYQTTDSIIYLFDSTFTTKFDTTREDITHRFSNRYKYLEIPLVVGYGFNRGRWTTSAKAGIIGSFLWKAKAQSIAGYSKNDVYSFTHDDFPTVRIDLYSALEVRYFIGSRYFVYGEAFYRRSYNPFIKRNNIQYHFKSYGLKLGAGVYF